MVIREVLNIIQFHSRKRRPAGYSTWLLQRSRVPGDVYERRGGAAKPLKSLALGLGPSSVEREHPLREMTGDMVDAGEFRVPLGVAR